MKRSEKSTYIELSYFVITKIIFEHNEDNYFLIFLIIEHKKTKNKYKLVLNPEKELYILNEVDDITLIELNIDKNTIINIFFS